MEVVIPLVTMTANTDVNDVTGAMVMDEESKLTLLIKFSLSFMNLFFTIYFAISTSAISKIDLQSNLVIPN